MLKLRRWFWDGLSGLEKIQFFILFLVAIVITVLSEIGIVPIGAIPGLTLALLAFIAWELFTLRTKLERSNHLREAGLHQIIFENKDVEWNSLIEDSTEIEILGVSPSSWLSNNITAILLFLKQPHSRLRLILPDPNNQAIVREIAHRQAREPQSVKSSIERAFDEYSHLQHDAVEPGQIEIWFSSVSPILTIYRFDSGVVISTNSYNPNRGKVPHFVANRAGTMYNFAVQEFHWLLDSNSRRNLCKKVF